MDKKDKNLILEFKRRLPSDIKPHLKRIIAFGSRVRGDFSPDSDLDMVVLIDEDNPTIKQKLKDTLYDVMLDNDFKPIISLKTFSESKFQDLFNRGFSFYRHVLQEGIPI